MFGVHFTGRHCTTIAGAEGLCLTPTGKRDLSANHHDARVPIMCVLRVHFARLQASVENLIPLTPQLGFKLSLIHGQTFLAVMLFYPTAAYPCCRRVNHVYD